MKVLIVGLGSIAKKHTAAIKKIDPIAEIVALRSGKEADQYEEVKNIFSWEEVDAKLDFIIISTPTSEHYRTIEQAMKFNVPLFIEKPSLGSLEGAEKLSVELKKKNIPTYVACNLRFHPAIQYVREYITAKEPRINEVNIYCGSWLPGWRAGRDFKTIYSANREMGGGVHLDLIHELDYTSWIFGLPTKVHALRRSASSLEINADDYASYNLEYEGFVAGIVLNYYRRDLKRTFELVFDNCTWTADLVKNEIKDENGNMIFTSNYNPADSYTSQMKYFTETITRGEQPMNSFDESVEVLKICLYE